MHTREYNIHIHGLVPLSCHTLVRWSLKHTKLFVLRTVLSQVNIIIQQSCLRRARLVAVLDRGHVSTYKGTKFLSNVTKREETWLLMVLFQRAYIYVKMNWPVKWCEDFATAWAGLRRYRSPTASSGYFPWTQPETATPWLGQSPCTPPRSIQLPINFCHVKIFLSPSAEFDRSCRSC